MWSYENVDSKSVKFIKTYLSTSKYRFHKFWSFNPTSDIIVKIGSKKKPKVVFLIGKVIEGLKWSQTENKLIYQVQFVVERSEADLYGVLEGVFRKGNVLKILKLRWFLWRL